MPKAIVAASNEPSSVGRASASPTTKVRPGRSANRRFATPIIAGEMSIAEDAPARLGARVEVGRDLAGPGRDIEDAIARLDAASA